jgi:hypothetical protein
MVVLVKGSHVRHVTQVVVCCQVQQPVIIQMVVVIIMMRQIWQHGQLSCCHCCCAVAAAAAAASDTRVPLQRALAASSSCGLHAAAGDRPAAADAGRAPHGCHGSGGRPAVCCGCGCCAARCAQRLRNRQLFHVQLHQHRVVQVLLYV